MDIGQVLEKAILSPDAQVRAEAEAQLQSASRDHFVPYLSMLTEALGTPSNRVEVRMLAGLALKNELTAKDLRTRATKAQRWLELEPAAKQQIKNTALEALRDTNERVAGAAAQLVAAIADIELPLGEWRDLTSILVQNTEPSQSNNVKKASLTCIGYICEGADPQNEGVVSQMDGLLTAIIQGAQKAEPNMEVRLTAMQALVNSLEFIRNNFANESERNFIMQVVCEATQQPTTPELQSAAFGAMSRIMSLYYDYMRPYMEQALFQLTVEGMTSSDEMVTSMAVEFWSTVCEEEIEIALLQQDAAETGAPLPASSRHESYHFALTALPQILPTLLQLLTHQDEDQDEDDWSVPMAAGACLQLLAQDTRDAIIQTTVEFVAANIQSDAWNKRDAAVMAFGSILDGPDPSNLRELITQALRPLLQLMADPSTHVKDTVAWCLGRIADLVVGAINVQEDLPLMIQALLEGLKDVPRVSTNCCWTLMNLAEQLSPEPHSPTSPLSQFYPQLLPALLQASARADNENSARTSAYEALSTLVIYAAADVDNLVLELSGSVVERLQATVAMQSQIVSSDDRVNLEELQVNLLGLLTNIIRRVGSKVGSGANQLMTLLLHILQNKLPNSLVEEDVFISVGAVAGAIGPAFNEYAPVFVQFLVAALKEPEYQSSSTAVGLVADISHAIGPEVAQYVPTFMNELLAIVESADVRREIKPVVLSCIGDIASSIGGQFEPYLLNVNRILVQGAQLPLSPETPPDMVDYIWTLREAILDAYVGIVAGLRDYPQMLQPVVEDILQFLHLVARDPDLAKTESVVRNAVGLLGDLASMYPDGTYRNVFTQEWVTGLIKCGRDKSFNAATRETAKWARDQQRRQIG